MRLDSTTGTWWLAAVGIAVVGAVLIVGIPSDVDRSLTTRPDGGFDPLLHAALLGHTVNSLGSGPAGYFRAPFLHPDRNPMRGTEPLVAQSILAWPVRVLMGDRPLLLYTLVRGLLAVVLVLGAAWLLRQIGVARAWALVGGVWCLALPSTIVFLDRVQDLSVAWVLVALGFAVRAASGKGGLLDAVAFAVAVALAALGSLYLVAMMAALVPFVAVPVVRQVAAAANRSRLAPPVAGAVAAGVACAAFLRPWLVRRPEAAFYASPEVLDSKDWGPLHFVSFLRSPLELADPSLPLWPPVRHDGIFPGPVAVLVVALLAAIGLAASRGSSGPRHPRTRRRAAPRVSTARRARNAVAITLAAVVLPHVVASGWASPPAWTLAPAPLLDLLVWALLLAWTARLLARPPTPSDRLRHHGSLALYAGLVLLLLGLGSPIRGHIEGASVATGIFDATAAVVRPLREMRELRRFAVPAGVAIVLGVTIQLHRATAGWGRRARIGVAGALLALLLGGRVGMVHGSVSAEPPPAILDHLGRAGDTGALVMLPLPAWNSPELVQRMLWQRAHGRPIVGGQTGYPPGWHAVVREVLGGFPSRESLVLLQAMGVRHVIVERSRDGAGTSPRAPGLRLAAETEAHRLWSLAPSRARRIELPAPPDRAEWSRPEPAGADPGAAFHRATDGRASVLDPARVGPTGLAFRVPDGSRLSAVLLDFGAGHSIRIPPRVDLCRVRGAECEPIVGREQVRTLVALQLLDGREPVIRLEVGDDSTGRAAGRFRLTGGRRRWDLPELRILTLPGR